MTAPVAFRWVRPSGEAGPQLASPAAARRDAVETALGRRTDPCDPVGLLWGSLLRAGWRIAEDYR